MSGDGGVGDPAVQTWASAEAVEQWQRGAERRAAALGPATERMLEAAALRPGQRVLDLAAGSGDQTVLAARAVAPGGSVLAVDISASMLAAAEATARRAGLDNVTTLAADMARLELPDDSFDAAICRLGLMFLPDLPAALERIRRMLKPGARLAALVWSTPERNPYMSTAIDVVREMGRLPDPPPTVLRALSLGAPGRLEQAFAGASFSAVGVEPVPIVRTFASLDETLELLRGGSSPQTELMQTLSEAECERAWAEIARRLEAYARPDGALSLPGEVLLAAGTK